MNAEPVEGEVRHPAPGSKEGIRAFYDELAPRLGHYREKNGYYYRSLGRLFRFLIPAGARVLDLGCGQGDFLAELNPSSGVGVDISPTMVQLGRERFPQLRFYVGDVEELDIEEEPFDFVLISNVVGFLQDIQRMFRSLRPYVKPETRVVVTHFNYLWAPILKAGEHLGMKVKEPHQNWLPLAELENILGLEDFEVVRERQAMLMPKRIPLLSTFLNRFVGNLPLVWRLSLVEILVARPAPGCGEEDGEHSCSVIVPARNEKGTIEDLVRRLPAMGSHTEIVFVEGHSTDGTFEEICRVRDAHPHRDIKVFRQEGEGKADAVRKGFAEAAGEVLMILDADLTVPPEELPKFFEAVSRGKGELVMGSRMVYRLQKESMRYVNMLGNKFFRLMFSYVLEQRVTDTLCGTKALRRGAYDRVCAGRDYFGNLDPFGDFDLILGADKANLKIVEIPVRYEPRQYGETQIRRFRHGVLLLRMAALAVWKLRWL